MADDEALKKYVNGRLSSLRVNRWSWWCHWRELADYILPRRYRWLITPNQWLRGSPINQHIIDNTGTIAARDLASGIMSGVSSPSRPFFGLKVGRIDTTQTSPASLWLAECVRLMRLVFQDSNFYNSIAQFWADLVVFGTAVMLIYEDFDHVINCFNPCAGEYYVDNDGKMRPCILYREFTRTVGQIVDEFGIENCSENIKQLYERPDGSGKAQELIIAHAVEPNTDPTKWGISAEFKYVEVYWEYGGNQGQQTGGAAQAPGFLRKKGYFEQFAIIARWDLTGNDAYGRSPGMEALGDIKQLQQQQRRKGQAIDKGVNPPMVADVQLKNQPASTLPGGMTYVSGFASSGKPAFQSVYDARSFSVKDISEDMEQVKQRIKDTFFVNIFRVISQYETKSNISVVEITERRAEAMVMLGPVLKRMDKEALSVIIERVFNMMVRARILPPAPPEIAGKSLDIEYFSMLAAAQDASEAGGIERVLNMAGGLAGVVGPEAMDNLDTDYAIAKFSNLMQNDPKLVRSPEQLVAIRQQRAQQAQQAQAVEMAEKLAAGAKTLSETQLGSSSALQQLAGPGLGAV